MMKKRLKNDFYDEQLKAKKTIEKIIMGVGSIKMPYLIYEVTMNQELKVSELFIKKFVKLLVDINKVTVKGEEITWRKE